MELTSDIGELLRHYTTAAAVEPPAGVREDFELITRTAPHAALAEGLAEAFRSSDTPRFCDMVRQLYAGSNSLQKAGVLNRLLTSVGPSLLPRLAEGEIPGLQEIVSSPDRVVMPEQAEQIPAETVRQVAAEAEKRDPSVVHSVSDFYAHHPGVAQKLGAVALTVVLIRIASYSVP